MHLIANFPYGYCVARCAVTFRRYAVFCERPILSLQNDELFTRGVQIREKKSLITLILYIFL